MTKADHFFRTYKNRVLNGYYKKIDGDWVRVCGYYLDKIYYAKIENSPNDFLGKLDIVERKLKLEKLLK